MVVQQSNTNRLFLHEKAQIEMFATPEVDKMHLFISIVDTTNCSLAVFSAAEIPNIRIAKMKNYHANDNIMRITCEDETNLLHIIEIGGLYTIIKEKGAEAIFLVEKYWIKMEEENLDVMQYKIWK